VLDRVKRQKRYAWMLLSKDTVVKDVHDGTLLLGMREGQRANFLKGGHDDVLRQALIDELGVDWKVEVLIDGPADGAPPSRETSSPDPTISQPPPDPASAAPPSNKPGPQVSTESANQTPADDRGSDEAAAIGDPLDGKPSDDDDVVADVGLSSHELLARELGAEIIEEREAR
jgi:DNA polymerase-3 subunit gamma/tau